MTYADGLLRRPLRWNRANTPPWSTMAAHWAYGAVVLAAIGCGASPAPNPTTMRADGNGPQPAASLSAAPSAVPVAPTESPLPMFGASPPRRLAAGADFSCVLRPPGGTVACWGNNDAGQLGDGTSQLRFGVIEVKGMTAIIEVVAGGKSACARSDAGEVWCWGQLGGKSGAPQRVAGVVASQLGVTDGSACAVQSGRLHCWNGDGHYPLPGQLLPAERPTPTMTDAARPASLDGAEPFDVAEVVLDGERGFARTTSGLVWGWRRGEGSAAQALEVVAGLDDVVELDMRGDDTCVRRHSPDETGYTVSCWSRYRKLTSPIKDRMLRPIAVYLGADWGCAQSHWAMHCWGGGPRWVGDDYYLGFKVERSAMVVNPSEVVAGDGHLCALLESGEVMCWGGNNHGQLGVSPGLIQPRPLRVPFLKDITQLVSGLDHLCANDDMTITCWGEDSDGRLGATSADSPHRWQARQLQLVNTYDGHMCALGPSGTVTCWGRSEWGQVGDGPPRKPAKKRRGRSAGLLGSSQLGNRTNRRAFVLRVKGVAGARAVATSVETSCAIGSGGVSCWGRSGLTEEEQRSEDLACRSSDDIPLLLADTRRDPKDCAALQRPTLVPATSGASALVGMSDGFCILQNDFARCWDRPQLKAKLQPWRVANLNKPRRLFGSDSAACALDEDSNLLCWTLANAFARQVPGLRGSLNGAMVVSMDSGPAHHCAVDSRGNVHCWGKNDSGQLGYAPSDARYQPVRRVANLPSAISVTLGRAHSCALTHHGEVWCWGGPRIILGGPPPLLHSEYPIAVEGLR